MTASAESQANARCPPSIWNRTAPNERCQNAYDRATFGLSGDM